MRKRKRGRPVVFLVRHPQGLVNDADTCFRQQEEILHRLYVQPGQELKDQEEALLDALERVQARNVAKQRERRWQQVCRGEVEESKETAIERVICKVTGETFVDPELPEGVWNPKKSNEYDREVQTKVIELMKDHPFMNVR